MKALLILLVFYSYFPSFSRPPSQQCQAGYKALYENGRLNECVKENQPLERKENQKDCSNTVSNLKNTCSSSQFIQKADTRSLGIEDLNQTLKLIESSKSAYENKLIECKNEASSCEKSCLKECFNLFKKFAESTDTSLNQLEEFSVQLQKSINQISPDFKVKDLENIDQKAHTYPAQIPFKANKMPNFDPLNLNSKKEKTTFNDTSKKSPIIPFDNKFDGSKFGIFQKRKPSSSTTHLPKDKKPSKKPSFSKAKKDPVKEKQEAAKKSDTNNQQAKNEDSQDNDDIMWRYSKGRYLTFIQRVFYEHPSYYPQKQKDKNHISEEEAKFNTAKKILKALKYLSDFSKFFQSFIMSQIDIDIIDIQISHIFNALKGEDLFNKFSRERMKVIYDHFKKNFDPEAIKLFRDSYKGNNKKIKNMISKVADKMEELLKKRPTIKVFTDVWNDILGKKYSDIKKEYDDLSEDQKNEKIKMFSFILEFITNPFLTLDSVKRAISSVNEKIIESYIKYQLHLNEVIDECINVFYSDINFQISLLENLLPQINSLIRWGYFSEKDIKSVFKLFLRLEKYRYNFINKYILLYKHFWRNYVFPVVKNTSDYGEYKRRSKLKSQSIIGRKGKGGKGIKIPAPRK